MENQIEEPVQALRDENVEGDTQNETVAFSEVSDPSTFTPPVIERRAETWHRDDTRKLVKVGEYLRSRSVDMLLACPGCREMVKLEGYDNGGAALMGCGCAVRRWV